MNEEKYMSSHSRRTLLKWVSSCVPISILSASHPVFATDVSSATPELMTTDAFPSHPPELAREVVLASHVDYRRVKELVDRRPALARAAWDWGFGDWEDALGAASHMGNRPVAEYLIEKGARPTLFSATMLGQLEVVKAFLQAHPGGQRIRGPHSISLMAHAEAGRDQARSVLEYLKSLDGSDSEPESPLSDADKAQLVGIYTFGRAPNQQIEVTPEKSSRPRANQINWTRRGTMVRQLFHLGKQVFYPAGAPDVRVEFTEENKITMMTITDAGLKLVARKV